MTDVDYGPCVHTLRRRLEAAEAEVVRLRSEPAEGSYRDGVLAGIAEASETVRKLADFYRSAGEIASADHAVGAIHAARDAAHKGDSRPWIVRRAERAEAEVSRLRAVVKAARTLSRFRADVETWTTDDVAREGELLAALDGALAAYDAGEVPRG